MHHVEAYRPVFYQGVQDSEVFPTDNTFLHGHEAVGRAQTQRRYNEEDGVRGMKECQT